MSNKTQFSPKQDDSITTKHCSRFRSHSNKGATLDSAIIYLKLRNEGCSKRQALNFSSKGFCRVDTTIQKDGPTRCKALTVKHDPYSITNNVNMR